MISSALLRSVEQQIEAVFQAVLGSEQTVRFVRGQEAASLSAMDAASSEELVRQWTRHERLLFLHLGRSRNEWSIRACEYDPRFQLLGPVSELRTLQREMIPDAAARAVLQSFSPVAVIRSATGTNVQLEFLGDERMANYRHWMGLSGDVGLQVMREPQGKSAEPQRATRFRNTFLALRSWQGNHAEGELIGPDKLFRDIDSTSVRYVARPIRGGDPTPRVRAVRKENRQPQPDCEVFLSPQQYSTDPSLLRGLTDRTGSLTLNLPGGGLQYVCLRYEDLVMKAPLLPGASADPMVFEVPTRGRRAEFIRPLRQLLQEIDDQYLVDVRLREELKARVDAKDTAEVRRLIERGRSKRISFDDIEARTNEVERRAAAEGEDIREAAAQVRQNAAQKNSRQLEQTLLTYADWADKFDKKSGVDSLNTKINDLQEKMDWNGLVAAFEQLLELDPDNQKINDELRLLKKDLAIKSPEHGEAREWVDNELPRLSGRDLGRSWEDVDRHAHVLIKLKDHLTLMKLRRSMNKWALDIGQQVKDLIGQIQAAGDDELRANELRDRLDELDELNKSLSKLHNEIQAFLKTLKL